MAVGGDKVKSTERGSGATPDRLAGHQKARAARSRSINC